MYQQLVPTVTRVVITSADTEYSLSLAGVKAFSVQCRTAVDLRFAFETGKVATPTEPYMTLKSGAVLNSPADCEVHGVNTLYLAAASGSLVAEVLLWKSPSA